MIKVMWFLKRAEHLSLPEFRRWWIEEHVPFIAADQKPFLKRYIVDVRVDDVTPFLGRPVGEFPWDGIAEQWFDTVEDYNAVYGRTDRVTRADTLEHTSAFQQLVVEEHVVPL